MFMALMTLVFIHLCALITPGPDFFLVSQTAISHSRKDSFYVVLGISCSVMVWALLALLGLNIIFEKMAWLRQVLFILGGIYLCYLGLQMLRAAFAKKSDQASTVLILPQSGVLFFLKGFLTNLSNPKAVIYFGSVFSLFLVNPKLEGLHALLLFIVTIETVIWFSLVMLVFSMPRFKAAYENAARWIDGISGGIFTLFGLYLIGHK
ncbi:MAG: LysE family transporter [Acinetobacter populi]|jgi:threonine efflux protein|uniref:LysE family transporter n=1 Tax=Acinetobacter populi TaxID=1582270 RepID=UPI0023522D9C|nr:LysE family transporter [Acinetobacter populi]MCH4247113.1 LysE family transporter [Acinetobacter populi]